MEASVAIPGSAGPAHSWSAVSSRRAQGERAGIGYRGGDGTQAPIGQLHPFPVWQVPVAELLRAE